MRFRFRDCVVDVALFELRRGGQRVELEPKVLRLLLFLLENRERAVAKDEILDAVWPGTAVGEGSLTRAVSLARAALGEPPGGEIIRTVRGRGYRIGVPVALESDTAGLAGAAAGRSDFLCRERELGLARDALLQALAGRGQVLVLVGEPGIGKTRLAEEVAALARERGADVCWGRCREGEGAPAFWPWIQILRACLAARGSDALPRRLGAGTAEIAEIVPELRDRLPGLPFPDRRDAGQARFRLFDAVTALLRAAAADRPLVLVLDDLHSADEPSLRLLQFLGEEIRDCSLLVLATYRDAEVRPGDPLSATLAELLRVQRPQRTIFLGGLSEGCVRRFVERFAGSDPAPELVEALHRRTEGNPLFLLELLQWIQGRDEGWTARGSWMVSLPEGVKHVIGRRLEGLSPACHRLLEQAAVLGRSFGLPILARVCGRPEDELLAPLEEAERARIVEPLGDGPGRFRFSHGLIAETLRDRLGSAARVRLHHQVAEVLEQLYTPRALARTDLPPEIAGARLAELAHHFGEAAVAGDAARAVDYSLRAAAHAAGVLAFEEAVRHYERALRLLDLAGGHSGVRRADLLVRLATAQQRSGHSEASLASLETAIACAQAAGDAEALAEAAIGLQQHAIGGNVFVENPACRRVLEQALAGLPGGDGALRARLLAALAAEHAFHGEAARGQILSAEALAMARRLRDPDVLWAVLRRERLYRFEPTQDAERAALVDEISRLARESGDPEREFQARFEYGLADALERADPDGVERELAACARLAETLRQPAFHWAVARAEGARALWQGRLAQAEAYLDQAREHGRRAGERADLSYHSALLALRRLQGRFAELEPALRADHRLAKARGHKWSALALLLAESGRTDEARAELAGLAADGFAAIRRDSNFDYNLALLSEVCTRVGDESAAAALHALLLPRAHRYLAIPGVVAAGCASRFLGLLATRLRHFGEAEAHFEAALEVERRMRARAFELCVERDFARLLAARGGPRDRVAARLRQHRAAELARELGLAGSRPPG